MNYTSINKGNYNLYDMYFIMQCTYHIYISMYTTYAINIKL